jgi:hypothetical protein
MVLVGGLIDQAFQSDTWLRTSSDGTWSRVRYPDFPAPRVGCQMAYLPALRGVVLTGGIDGFNPFYDDTWLFRDGRWQHLRPTTKPIGTGFGDMALDSTRGRIVMQGFRTSGTWEFDGQAWAKITTAAAPSSRSGHRLAYDQQRGAMVLFGGYDEGALVELADTWTYNGTNWTQLATTGTPPARDGHGMTYDVSRNAIVMFGGTLATAGSMTWELSGSTWSANAAPGPTVRYGAPLVYGDKLGASIVFSGADTAMSRANDAWEYSNGAWSSIAGLRPPARWLHCSAYDANTRRVVVFGGERAIDNAPSSDTWTLGYE